MEKLNGLDIFTGIGGNTLALSEWVRPLVYCDNDRYCQAVLLSLMSQGKLPIAPIWDDVRTLKAEMLPKVDIVYAGFPCQDISVAGSGVGLEGERSGLVFEVFRLVGELAPTFVFLENVPGIRTRGAERVGKEMARLGYDCRWLCLSAQEIGALHKRNRWFMLAAHTHGIKIWKLKQRMSRRFKRSIQVKRKAIAVDHGKEQHVANTECDRLQRSEYEIQGEGTTSLRRRSSDQSDEDYPGAWHVESSIFRVANGVPFAVDRIKCIGNSVVPMQAKEAFKRLIGL